MLEINKIYHGDCIDIMKQIDDNSIDLTVTSPPYDNLRTYNGYSFDFEKVAKELYRITKQGGCVVWVVGDATTNGSETGTSFKQALYFKEIGFNLHDTMIYHKLGTGACGSNLAYWQSFEYMFILSKGKPTTVNLLCDVENLSAGQVKKNSGRRRRADGAYKQEQRPPAAEFSRRTNIWSYAVGVESRQSPNLIKHPAIFPEKLATDHILTWSKERDLIFDPFSGSGTTARMAFKTKRNYIACDVAKDYVDLSNDLMKQLELLTPTAEIDTLI